MMTIIIRPLELRLLSEWSIKHTACSSLRLELVSRSLSISLPIFQVADNARLLEYCNLGGCLSLCLSSGLLLLLLLLLYPLSGSLTKGLA